MAYFGERLFAWLSEIPAFAWAIAGAVLVVLAVVATFVWMRRRARTALTEDRLEVELARSNHQGERQR